MSKIDERGSKYFFSRLELIRQRQIRYLGHVRRKESLGNLTRTGPTEGEGDREKQRITHLNRICKWWSENDIRRHSKKTSLAQSQK